MLPPSSLMSGPAALSRLRTLCSGGFTTLALVRQGSHSCPALHISLPWMGKKWQVCHVCRQPTSRRSYRPWLQCTDGNCLPAGIEAVRRNAGAGRWTRHAPSEVTGYDPDADRKGRTQGESLEKTLVLLLEG